MTQWLIVAQVRTRNGDYSGSRQVPSFILDGSIQGITDASHAALIAAEVINPLGTIDLADMTITAEPILER